MRFYVRSTDSKASTTQRGSAAIVTTSGTNVGCDDEDDDLTCASRRVNRALAHGAHAPQPPQKNPHSVIGMSNADIDWMQHVIQPREHPGGLARYPTLRTTCASMRPQHPPKHVQHGMQHRASIVRRMHAMTVHNGVTSVSMLNCELVVLLQCCCGNASVVNPSPKSSITGILYSMRVDRFVVAQIAQHRRHCNNKSNLHLYVQCESNSCFNTEDVNSLCKKLIFRTMPNLYCFTVTYILCNPGL